MARTVAGLARRVLRWSVVALLAFATFIFVVAGLGTASRRVERPAAAATVDDITRLYRIPVAQVLAPTSTEEIVAALRAHPGPVAIGGGRYSMGGQTATEGALQLDLRQFNRILAFSPGERTITVQAGTRWRQIQEHIDSADLSVKIMQTYANFTVGGSLSVNVHGRYVGLGPVILSVRSLKVVLADGTVVEASATRNPEIFYGVIGGYGGLGVITEVTLDLAENVGVKRRDRTMPIASYAQFFRDSVRNTGSAIFHNGDIYPDDYTTVHAVTFDRTDDSVTVKDRMIPADRSYRLNRFVYWMLSEWPFGNTIRQHLVDPLLYRGEPVFWRNYEASYDVAELEPASRERSTYVLQEYFVPVERFDEFVPRMRDILRRHDVNVINVSIRHAVADPGALLAWAHGETFAFVIYYKQGTGKTARRAVATWTRELVDATLASGGSYYLPYQPHATPAQFARAYPRSTEFFALKRRLDPSNKFRNKLWDKYYDPARDTALDEVPAAFRAALDARTDYRRDEGQTFLTHPEWYIVYNSDEYAEWLQQRLPTDFPYRASIGQFWVDYREARALTRDQYPANWGYHVMLGVIGTSYTVELALKGFYENTVGRVSGWTSRGDMSDEDRLAAAVATEYGKFIHVRPWYEFPFNQALKRLWGETPIIGRHPVRKLERRAFLNAEYGVKALYAAAIKAATRATYGVAEDRMLMVTEGWSDTVAARHSDLQLLEQHGYQALLSAPRYDGFRDVLLGLARTEPGVRIREIAGNDEILLTGVAPADWSYTAMHEQVVYGLTFPSDPTRKRVVLRVPVPQLLNAIRRLDAHGGITIDHIYDY